MDTCVTPSPSSQAQRVILTEDRAALVGDVRLVNVHRAFQCVGRVCVMHNPTDHPMVTWPLTFDGDTTLVQRVCSHDVAHPDPDSMVFFVEIGYEHVGEHDCDGCCEQALQALRSDAHPNA